MRRGKYNAVRTNGYASKREAETAANLHILEKAGIIVGLREQVPITLIEGKGKVRPIKYIADFHYIDKQGVGHWIDAKGYKKNAVYLLKKKMLYLLHGIELEEV